MGVNTFTKSGTTMGTTAYMSPEQLRGEVVDNKTDIWAFGVVLYEMLTGSLPFGGEYEAAIMYSILNEKPQPVSTLVDNLQQKFNEILEKALAKKPDDRYENMNEIIEDLKILSNGTKDIISIITKPKQVTKPSIAVLPFANMSSDPDQEYFCDGIAEEIINSLTHVENLHVVARTSSFFFKGEKVDIRQIGDKLNVAHVLEGSVRKAGNRLRITAQLVKVTDSYQIWSERYDRTMDDVFAIQDEISLAIVDKLKVNLLTGERSAILKRYTENVNAYNLYLKGAFYFQLLDPKGFKLAIDCFQQVLSLDPGYALAHVGLGSVNALRIFIEDGFPPHDVIPQAKLYAQKALQIDADLSEAHALLARIHSQYEWNWTAAEDGYLAALKLNPNYALGHAWYALHLSSVGRHEEAIPFAKRAAELDPLSSYIKAMLAERLNMHRQFDSAIEYAKEAISLNPNNAMAYAELGMGYEGKSMVDEAIIAYEKAVTFSSEHFLFSFCSACFYHQTGDLERATKLFENLKATSKLKFILPIQLFFIYRAMGEFDLAYEWLAQAVEVHDPLLLYFNEFPVPWARIPDEPRFRALVQKIGLTPNPA